MNSSNADAKKDGKQLEQIMLTNNEWDLLKELIIVLGPFEEATRFLGGEKYITHSIMHPIINQIKKLLLLPTPSLSTLSASPSTLSTSPPISSTSSTFTSTSSISSEILAEIENANDVFVVIEEVEILETEEINDKNNNQRRNKIDLNKPLETKDILEKVKKNLYNAICVYWKFVPEDYLISTILDPRVKYIDDKTSEEEILREKYEEYKENYIPTPVESRPTSPTLSETSTFSTIIYKPTLFAIFEQDQHQRVSDEVTEYLREDKIPFNQDPFDW